jgi:hypothetical protein
MCWGGWGEGFRKGRALEKLARFEEVPLVEPLETEFERDWEWLELEVGAGGKLIWEDAEWQEDRVFEDRVFSSVGFDDVEDLSAELIDVSSFFSPNYFVRVNIEETLCDECFFESGTVTTQLGEAVEY